MYCSLGTVRKVLAAASQPGVGQSLGQAPRKDRTSRHHMPIRPWKNETAMVSPAWESMNDQLLDRNLRSVGREGFVAYLTEFCDRWRSNEDVATQTSPAGPAPVMPAASSGQGERRMPWPWLAARRVHLCQDISRKRPPNWSASGSQACYEQATVAEDAIARRLHVIHPGPVSATPIMEPAPKPMATAKTKPSSRSRQR